MNEVNKSLIEKLSSMENEQDIIRIMNDKFKNLIKSKKSLIHTIKLISNEQGIIKIMNCLFSISKNASTLLNDTCKKDIAEELSKELINIDARNSKGETALMLAEKNGMFKLMEYLLDKGANIDIQNNNGKTVLMIALDLYNFDSVNKLLDKNASVEMQDIYGQTPLMYVIKNNRISQIQEFLYAKNRFMNPKILHHFFKKIDRSSKSILRKMLNKVTNIDIKDIYGQTSLTYAMKNDDWASIKELLLKGANSNICDEEGKIPLMYAIKYNDSPMIRQLLIKGTDPNIQDIYGQTPLMYTIMHYNWSILKKMLDNGADPNIRNNNGQTPLMYAFIYESKLKSDPTYNTYSIIDNLLKKNANPNIQDVYGKTALMYAIEKESDVFIFLLENTDLNLLDNSKQTALIYAIKSRNYKIIDMILYYQKSQNCIYKKENDNVWKLALEYAIESKDFRIFDKLSSFLYSKNSKMKHFDEFITDLVKLVDQDLFYKMYQEKLNGSYHNKQLVKYILDKDKQINNIVKFSEPDVSYADLESATSWIESSIQYLKLPTEHISNNITDDTECTFSDISTEIIEIPQNNKEIIEEIPEEKVPSNTSITLDKNINPEKCLIL